jgi:hypothetical protein
MLDEIGDGTDAEPAQSLQHHQAGRVVTALLVSDSDDEGPCAKICLCHANVNV